MLSAEKSNSEIPRCFLKGWVFWRGGGRLIFCGEAPPFFLRINPKTLICSKDKKTIFYLLHSQSQIKAGEIYF